MANFEIKSKDLAGRIGKLQTKHGEIETPTVMPVMNPNKITLKPKKIMEIGAQALITNAYILKKNHLHEVITQGIHNFLDFSGPIMTDSGAYQLMRYGEIGISNKEVLEFQEKINTDIGVILDIPTDTENKEKLNKAVKKTIERSKESEEYIKDKKTLYVGPLQGWKYPDIFRKSVREQSKLDFDIHALGSIVPTMERYQYHKLMEPLRIIKEEIPENRPIHLFGAGHPMLFPFLVAMGADLFDSAAYSLYAQDGRYLTPTGTKKINKMDYLPCSCPICTDNTVEDLKKPENQVKLAEHNLHITFEEIRQIKQSIREGTLYEILETKSRAHPALKKLMDELTNDMRTIQKRDPITKKHLFMVSKYSKKRPDYQRALKKAKEIEGKRINIKEFGEVPVNLLECYPYSHIGEETLEEIKGLKINDLEKLKSISEYWLDLDIIPEDVEIIKSPKTGRIRNVNRKGNLYLVIRSSDHMMLLHEAARELHERTKYPKHRIVMDKEAEEFVERGETIFNKFVEETDPELKPGEPVLITNKDDRLLASGESYLSAKEIMEFKKGEAAKNRWNIKR